MAFKASSVGRGPSGAILRFPDYTDNDINRANETRLWQKDCRRRQRWIWCLTCHHKCQMPLASHNQRPVRSEWNSTNSIYIVNDSLYNLYFFGSHKSDAVAGESTRRGGFRGSDNFVAPMWAQNKNVFTSGLHSIQRTSAVSFLSH